MPAPDHTKIHAEEFVRELAEETRHLLSQWEFALNPEGKPPWFNGYELAPPFDPAKTDFTPENAWWLSELCRLVYTPDNKERNRPWHKDEPLRSEFLEKRSPFREDHSIHRTGNHAAIYTRQSPDFAPFTVLCFRGTNKLRQWIMNLTALPIAWDKEVAPEIHVHKGFKILFDRVWPLVEPCLVDAEGPLFFTGHSLGAALATMAAMKVRPSALYTFGSPRVGNEAFYRHLASVPHHRIVNHHDIVPLLPEREEKLGDRAFRHGGNLVSLEKTPGKIRIETDWDSSSVHPFEPKDPIAYLAKEFSSHGPPECIMNHAPASYSARLLEAVTGT